MCASNDMKLLFTIPLVIFGVLFVINFPELRRYFRIASM